jgi:hypothetical protein
VAGDAVVLDVDPTTLELADERAQELMTAPCGRRLELVKEGEVGARSPRAPEVDLETNPGAGSSTRSTGGARKSTEVHGGTR